MTGSTARIKAHPIPSSFSWMQKLRRAGWGVIYALAFRPSPRTFHFWRRWLLRLMGAHIAEGTTIYPSVKIWAPWNLKMDRFACLAPHVDCYNVAPVVLGERSTVSQYSYLCTATHDYGRLEFPLIAASISIGACAWVCADVFVGPGVKVGEGAVVGARSAVYKEVGAWEVVAGNPARFLKCRRLAD